MGDQETVRKDYVNAELYFKPIQIDDDVRAACADNLTLGSNHPDFQPIRDDIMKGGMDNYPLITGMQYMKNTITGNHPVEKPSWHTPNRFKYSDYETEYRETDTIREGLVKLLGSNISLSSKEKSILKKAISKL